MSPAQSGSRLGFAAVLLASTSYVPLARAETPSASPVLVPHTLNEALAHAYLTNPQLQAERANLRSVDENVPTALAGWRPQVQFTAAGTAYGERFVVQNNAIIPTLGQTVPANQAGGPGGGSNSNYIAPLGYQYMATVTQPLYQGGRTTSGTHQAVNRVLAERANLLATEQTVMFNVVQAYVGVIENKQLLQLQVNNEQVLAEQLRATQDRFNVGEITRTDVAQAEASLAIARSQRQSAEGQLRTANAVYQQQVGVPPPDTLVDPQPIQLPVKTEQEAMIQSVENNPNVVYQLFTDAAARDAVDVAFSAIAPRLSLQGEYFQQVDQGQTGIKIRGGEGLLNLTVPIYQGGSEYAAVRQARQTEQQQHRLVDQARRTALESVISAWESLVAARAAVVSDHAAVRAGFVALDGVERQAIVGTSTTLEVLQQQQTLLTAQTTLVQNLATLVLGSYQVVEGLGQLTARDLHLDVPLYDDKAYYNAVKDRLWGTNDYAVKQPGR